MGLALSLVTSSDTKVFIDKIYFIKRADVQSQHSNLLRLFLMNKKIAIFLCDITGVMAKPWVEAGYEVILVDPQHPDGVTVEGLTTKVGHVIDHETTWGVIREAVQTGRVAFVAGFPPCTDLAVSGARWFQAKRDADPAVQFKAMHVVWQCQIIGELSGAPWFAENPVSQISSLWRKPDHSFHPWEFTGLVLGDCYWKKTCLWSGGGFQMPMRNVAHEVASCMAEVKKRINSLPMVINLDVLLETFADMSDKIRQFYPSDKIHKCPPGPERANIRSATPEGFARAVFLANAPHLKSVANDNKGPCAKQRVSCTIVHPDGRKWTGENVCGNPQKTCPRADMPTGVGYELCRDICQQLGHAELVALEAAGTGAMGATAYIDGHTYACNDCTASLKAAGVVTIEIGTPELAADNSNAKASEAA